MAKYKIPKIFTLRDVPEFKDFQAANPQNYIEEKQTIIMYGRAVHWMSILSILWPDFEHEDYYILELSTIVFNDPYKPELPVDFYKQLAHYITTFWRIQLEDLYPNGDWGVEMLDDPEMTIQVSIRRRN